MPSGTITKIIILTAVKNRRILHRRVIVMVSYRNGLDPMARHGKSNFLSPLLSSMKYNVSETCISGIMVGGWVTGKKQK